MDAIHLRGVRVHNLKNIDLDIPKGKLTVITGVSGSGKSSLAFDTLFAEGQRRYVESLSTYARQFLERMDRPDADIIEGIPPAIAIQQRTPTTGGRSTVGSVTEILDYMRLLWARIGLSHCVRCGRPVEVDTVDRIAEGFLGRHFLNGEARGTSEVARSQNLAADAEPLRIEVGFPVDAALVLETLQPAEFFAEVRGNGFLRVRINGRTMTLEEGEAAGFRAKDRLAVIVDRIVLRWETAVAQRTRFIDSLELAYRFGHEKCLVVASVETGAGAGASPVPAPARRDTKAGEQLFSRSLHCAHCDLTAQIPTPAFFSFNSPLGACPMCKGFGRSIEPDLDRIIPDRKLTLRQRPIEPWNFPSYAGNYDDLFARARKHGVPLDVPYARLRAAHRTWIQEGDDEFGGIAGFFRGLESKIYKVHVRVFLSRFRAYRTCVSCGGTRFRPESLAVKVGGIDIARALAFSTERARVFFDTLELSPMQTAIAGRIREELSKRLSYLIDVGLDYLTLDRLSRTLSGGEAQRIHLATSLGSGLVGSLYVLDEPSIGLHPRDNDRLIRILKTLRDLGNTVVVVEHDPAIIRAADWVVDLGPGAGEEGGQVVATGSPDEITKSAGNGATESLTALYLSGRRSVTAGGKSSRRRLLPGAGKLVLEGARLNNLKNITVEFPLGVFCCVTGVSGSGKSSLVADTLYPALRMLQGESPKEIGPHDALHGVEHLDGVVLVDQSPIGKSPRSNPVTYMAAFSEIRDAFAASEDARLRGLASGDFSFNRAGGRCEVCQGAGSVTAEMHFLADVTLVCEACGGSRYKEKTLAVRLRGKTIADILQMTASEAVHFFRDMPHVVTKLNLLAQAGLGYLRLGQPVNTLSGGEAQRLKLAEAMSHGKGRSLYLFDEPTTGLHLEDVTHLLACFDRLLERGHSLLVVEHHLDVIRAADWIIDMGPEAADAGGTIVAAGPPELIAENLLSITGRSMGQSVRGIAN